MPEMNGWNLADKLFAQHPDIKTLFMSRYTANAITRRGRMDEKMNFIQKPFPLKDLVIKAREVLDTPDPRQT